MTGAPESLLPSEVRERILDQHAELRAMLDHLEALANAERMDRGAVRAAFGAMLPHLQAHRLLEDDVLARALLEADAWGDVRTASLAEHHDVQARHMAAAWDLVQDPASPRSAVKEAALGAVARLRAEMAQEERELLDPRVLRDDIVIIGGFGG